MITATIKPFKNIGHAGNGTAADFNKDGYVDIVQATDIGSTSFSYTTPISVYTYNPTTKNYEYFALKVDGVVVDPQVYFGMYVTTHDINKDGIADIIPIDQSERRNPENPNFFIGATQYVYMSNGIGDYTKLSIGTFTPSAHGWGHINSADGKFRILYNTPFNDWTPDSVATQIATYNEVTKQFDVQLIKRSDPYFTSTPTPSYGVGYFYQTALDINNDGNTDIVGFSNGAYNNIYMNDGYGNFTYTYSINTGLIANSGTDNNFTVEEATIGDFNGDGYQDIMVAAINRSGITAPSNYNTLRVLINDQHGNFTDQTTQWLGNKFQDVDISYGYLDTFDFNHDGKNDVAFAHQTSNTWVNNVTYHMISVFVSNGTSFDYYKFDTQLSVDKPGLTTIGARIIPISDDSFVYQKDWEGNGFNAVATVKVLDKSISNAISGGSTNDKLTGTSGNDYIDGGAGADKMYGGAGDDTYVVDSSKDSVTEKANEGTDTILSSVNYTLKTNFENLTLTGTATTGTGNSVNNTITGNELNNILKGGAGNDTLVGGAGNDIFVFDSKLNGTTNIDVITDFVSGSDVINLSKKVFTAYKKAGVNLANDFVSEANATAHDTSDHLLYDTATGALYYDADGSGTKAAAIQFATLTGHPTLLASDLLIV